MDWKHFNVHLVWPDEHYEKICVTALSKDDAYADTRIHRAIGLGAYPIKVIGPLGMHKTTPKQQIAQQYRMCLGAAKMAKKALESVNFAHPAMEVGDVKFAKIMQTHRLALNQAAKLQRDIADMFKLMGLKIKHG